LFWIFADNVVEITKIMI